MFPVVDVESCCSTRIPLSHGGSYRGQQSNYHSVDPAFHQPKDPTQSIRTKQTMIDTATNYFANDALPDLRNDVFTEIS